MLFPLMDVHVNFCLLNRIDTMPHAELIQVKYFKVALCSLHLPPGASKTLAAAAYSVHTSSVVKHRH